MNFVVFVFISLASLLLSSSAGAGDEVYNGRVKPKTDLECLKNSEGQCMSVEELEEAKKKAAATPEVVAPKIKNAKPKVPGA